jgi:hypothetical protein
MFLAVNGTGAANINGISIQHAKKKKLKNPPVTKVRKGLPNPNPQFIYEGGTATES